MKKTNLEPEIATYLHGKGRRLGLPIAGNFELTARCNFNCPMCYVHLTPEQVRQQGRELTAAQWLKIAEEARDMGMLFVLLTGGEPFIREDFFEIYQGMKSMGLMISINSNGSMVEGEVLRQLLADPPSRMNISLYGGSNETYRRMCGQNAYDRVKENIRQLKAAGVDVSLNLSITPYNYQDLERIYRDAEALDVHVKASSYMYPPVRVDGDKTGCGNRLSPEEAARCSVQWDLLRFTPEEFQLRAEAMERLEAVEPPDCPTELTRGVRCRAGGSSFWMTWDGRMLPCGMLPGEGVRPLELGFKQAWEETRRVTAAITSPQGCNACPHRDLCPSCPAVCITETGSYDQVPGYVCKQTTETIRQTLWHMRKEPHVED